MKRPVTNKAELRAEMRRVRKALKAARPDAAERAAGHAGELIAGLGEGGVVAVYHAIGSELSCEPLVRALSKAGVALAAPRADAVGEAMAFLRWAEGEPLEPDQAGCPAPLDLAEAVVPDLIVTPLLGFDGRGFRLGQGGGYYDRTFAALRAEGRPFRAIGLAYAGQRVERLEAEGHDERLDAVLTEDGLIRFDREAE
ncbi:5-formyltetrahydrofolate cyclo-ligase [Brevundimonas sp. 2R-24]|uniref:5-formyltetrahydrofolate cyclo-ligase n=1 Tax=Peiella sedimenti TaxID=3061083 RepID=A0ABT8SLW2_9CAUL|nr:5-formyltetrahydrofolate cyclo-ligase [Caulobacteraceae bacterium XZ-24]